MTTRTLVLQHLRSVADLDQDLTPHVRCVGVAAKVGRSTPGVTQALRELASRGNIKIADRGPGGTQYQLTR